MRITGAAPCGSLSSRVDGKKETNGGIAGSPRGTAGRPRAFEWRLMMHGRESSQHDLAGDRAGGGRAGRFAFLKAVDHPPAQNPRHGGRKAIQRTGR